ncbi:TIGR02680 family protein [Leifsonia sp. Leaf264]|uniref:TIGR02680 family protein n=1 Tax=Leifsonia sp. Leaf264 TaxID=1736314 RepID=UPI0006F7386A|nr:TIGR02680 family protein [Leifsonia sp. Leaf264]KQO98341.1 hypothetical protein ASF30_09785 [Leifsonia sp. Leaf264]
MSIATVTRIAPATTTEFDDRARWCRAGIVNVHRYANITFHFSNGRLCLLGTNGSGKSRGMDMLFPFVISGDRRRMGSGTSGLVSVESLMKKMIGSVTNRVGYVWAECMLPDGSYLTVGAYLKYSTATRTSKVEYFITDLRVGIDLILVDDEKMPLPKDQLTEQIGSHRVTSSASTHRERVARELYGITDDRGMERFRAYLDLMYKLRAPDIGVRINGGELTQLLSETLPPLSDEVLAQAGGHLDGLQDIRAEQSRLERQTEQVDAALKVYAGYAVGVLSNAAKDAEAAAVEDRGARIRQADAQASLDEARDELAKAQSEESTARQAAATAQSRLTAIVSSSAYKDHLALNEKSATVAAIAMTANTSLGSWATARAAADRYTGTVTEAAESVELRGRKASAAVSSLRAAAAGAGIATDVPDVQVVLTSSSGKVRTVRLTVTESEVDEAAPDMTVVTVDDVTAASTKATNLREAAATKRDAAAARHAAAELLHEDGRQIEALEAEASAAASRAEAARAQVEQMTAEAASARAELASRWVAWSADEWVRQAFTGYAWADSPIGGFLEDHLDPFPDPAQLDRLADTVAGGARDRLSERASALTTSAAQLRTQESELRAEMQALTDRTVDIAPTAPSWAGKTTGLQLWRSVDFRPDVDDAVRAAVESALEASGLLTAVITDSGAVIHDGELVVSADGPVATSSLSQVLASEPDTDVTAVLDRIGFNSLEHPTNISSDGSFRVGQLHGKQAVSSQARFIGATSRERTRKARLEELQEQVAGILGQLTLHDEMQAQVKQEREQISKLVSEAPTADDVRNADARVGASNTEERRRRKELDDAEEAALKARSGWDTRMQAHRNLCSVAGLPWSRTELATVQSAAEATRAAAENLVQVLAELTIDVRRFEETMARRTRSEEEAADAGATALQAWREWSAANTELVQLRRSVGAESAAVLADQESATADLNAATKLMNQWGSAVPRLSKVEGTCESNLATASSEATTAAARAAEALGGLRYICQRPGILAAATGQDLIAQANVATSQWVRSAIGNRSRARIDSVFVALDALITDLSSDFEVVRHTDDLAGVLIVELADAEGQHSLADAAATLRDRTVTGKVTLAREENERFQRYIMDSVGEELRQSMLLAEETIAATSKRVSQYRTSNNIGVRLRMTANDTLGTELVRIRELVRIAGPVRTEQQTAELSTLLRGVVDQEHSANPGAGYEAALAKGFDYRNWFTVEAVILGPEIGQERGIRGAQLSSGELRYISYLTLTCAIDAQMSALPSAAPRLLLMDDAFAMVDVTGRRNLVQVIVERDIDFVMTGHDLWLTYPEVPGIDLYEIHTHGEDAPATAIHYHWDGSNRKIQFS